jgi:dTDP-glucose pyrophosphorylase
MLNIVIPMAGLGSRFAKVGYKDPKPLISVGGVPMIQVVINNLKPAAAHRFIFVCQRKHVAEYGLAEKFARWAPGCKLIELDSLTEGAACTVLAASDLIDNEDALMIANSDQYIDYSVDDYLARMEQENLDGLIMTMKADDPKWSFVELRNGLVTRVVEKEVISDEATVGIYNFRKGCDFVSAARDMISKNLRINNEFYVAPAYNQLIEAKARIGICNVGREADGMYGLGTPADLELFLGQPLLISAAVNL